MNKPVTVLDKGHFIKIMMETMNPCLLDNFFSEILSSKDYDKMKWVIYSKDPKSIFGTLYDMMVNTEYIRKRFNTKKSQGNFGIFFPEPIGNNSSIEIDTSMNESQSIIPLKYRCKLCKVKEIDSVFLDCTHSVYCFSCGSNIQNCPVCKQPIVKTLKYLITNLK